MFLLNGLYALASVILAAYSINWLVLLIMASKRWRSQKTQSVVRAPEHVSEWPAVTVQLPVYNESHVIERLIVSTCKLDYPRERLQIQVVDDSTDETTILAQRLVGKFKAQGHDINLIHRSNRVGFKGGALREALDTASGEFIAIFDADFVPSPYFLKSILPRFDGNPRLGMVQSRWGHLNRNYSATTRAQALAIDAHFTVEQTARSGSDLFMNFNGSGGVWRKESILDAGNWQDDTVCEDLDLSYRAQLRGWEFLYDPQVVSPAELPPQIVAFKRQQFRWAKGSIQAFMKLWRRLILAPDRPLKRLSALLHLTTYLIHPLLIGSLLILVPLIIWEVEPVHILVVFAGLSVVSPALIILSQRHLYPDWRKRLTYLPIMMFLGTGLAVNSLFAVWEAVTHTKHTFLRTPKFDLQGRTGQWQQSQYVLPLDKMFVVELLLGLYASVGVLAAASRANYGAAFFIAIYAASFLFISVGQLVQSLKFNHLSRVNSRRRLTPTEVSPRSHLSHIDQ